MKSVWSLVLLLATLQATSAQTLFNLNCYIGGCGGASPNCQTTGCSCGASEFNYDCKATADQAAGGACTVGGSPSCVEANTWECATDCTCKQGYYRSTNAQDCSLSRVRAVCRENDFDVYFAPYEGANFVTVNQGAVYQVDEVGTAGDLTDDVIKIGCALAEDSVANDEQLPGPLKVYSKLAQAYTTPGGDCVDATAFGGSGFTTTWYVQYGGTVSHNSVRFKIECVPQTGTAVPATISFVSATPGTPATASHQAEVQALGIASRIADAAGDLSVPHTASPVPADTEIALVTDLTLSAVYNNFVVSRATFFNYDPDAAVPADDTTNTPPQYKSLYRNLVSQTCGELWAGGGILKSFEKTNDGTTMRQVIKFTPFVFNLQALGYQSTDGTPTPVGTMWIQSELCMGTCTLPIPDSLAATAPSLAACDPNIHITNDATNFPDMIPIVNQPGRRRRQASELAPPGTTVTSNLSVVFLGYGNFGAGATRQTIGEETNCHQTLTFLLPIVILAVMLVAVMAMTAFFCLKVSRSQGHPEGHTNMAYK